MVVERLRAALTTPHNKWTPEQAFRWVVVPLALLFIILGVAFAVLFGTFNIRPNRPIPFMKSPEANRRAFYGVGVFSFVLGIGLLRRLRIAWFGFFAYVVVSTIFGILALIFDPDPSDPPLVMIPIIVAFNSAFAFVVFRTTQGVFCSNESVPAS
jgi:hypothetical protein